MKRISIAIWSLLVCAITINLAYAAQPEDKGKEKDKEPPGQARQEQTPPGQERQEDARAEQAASRAEAKAEQAQARIEQAAERVDARAQAAEVRAEQAALRAERAAETRQERQQDRQIEAKTERDASERASERRQDREERREQANMQVASLADSLSKLQHARWSFNPHDTRGQGNMGKVDMQDPFGFDKDSGREGQDRGRPFLGNEPTPTPEEPPVMEEPPATEPLAEEPPLIEEPSSSTEPALNLEGLVLDLQVVDAYLLELQWLLDIYRQFAASNPQYASYYDSMIATLESQIANYSSSAAATNDLMYFGFAQEDTLQYSLTLGTQDGYTGTSLQVTTSLITMTDYTGIGSWTYDSQTGTWQSATVEHQAGDVIFQQTQDVTLSEDGSSTVYSYVSDVPWDVLGLNYSGNTFSLSVTVTDPVSGTSYTTTYDRLYYMYHCPYGIIYDKTTGKAIAGATVTVHNEDGSVVLLEKASNPNVSNPQTTDATGRYNCKLAIGKKYYLSVKAPGYQDYKSQLFSERWHIVREDVALTPVKTSLPIETTPAAELMVPALSPAALPVK